VFRPLSALSVDIHMFMPKETDAFKEAFEKEIKGIK
jgi:hypothetical protein